MAQARGGPGRGKSRMPFSEQPTIEVPALRRDEEQPSASPNGRAYTGLVVTHVSNSVDVEVPERPQIAPDIELSGEMQDSAFSDDQFMVQRDGRFIQLTELLYRVTENV